MSRPPIHPRTFGQLALVAIVLVAATVMIVTVRQTAPQATLPAVTQPAPGPDDPGVVTCERTLPDAPETLEAIREVDPVGRVTSTDVIECPDAFDGQPVIYIGEVVGDVLRRDGGAWMLVNDDAYALEAGPLQGHSDFRGANTGLSVWLPDPLPALVAGGPDRRGTILEIRGVVRRTDPADGGGLTLRGFGGSGTRVVAASQEISKPLNRGQALAAGVVAAAALALVAAERRNSTRK